MLLAEQVPMGEEGPFPHPSGDGRQFTAEWALDDIIIIIMLPIKP
jgi:hypothetical protein